MCLVSGVLFGTPGGKMVAELTSGGGPGCSRYRLIVIVPIGEMACYGGLEL